MYVVKLGDEVYELLDWQPPPGKPGGAALAPDRQDPATPASGGPPGGAGVPPGGPKG